MLNQVTIQGRMAKDAEDRMMNNGKVMTTFSVAVQRNYKIDGKYEADFIDCVAFDKIAEHIGKYFHKGDMILLTGELQTKLYEDKNGKKHKAVAVRVNSTYFVTDKAATSSKPANVSGNDELPFE